MPVCDGEISVYKFSASMSAHAALVNLARVGIATAIDIDSDQPTAKDNTDAIGLAVGHTVVGLAERPPGRRVIDGGAFVRPVWLVRHLSRFRLAGPPLELPQNRLAAGPDRGGQRVEVW